MAAGHRIPSQRPVTSSASFPAFAAFLAVFDFAVFLDAFDFATLFCDLAFFDDAYFAPKLQVTMHVQSILYQKYLIAYCIS